MTDSPSRPEVPSNEAALPAASTALVPGAIERDPAIVRTRVTCALLYFAARQVPVPLLDDVLRTQVAAYMVKSSVKRAGLSVPSDQLAPLFEKDQHWAVGCLWWMFKLPFKILLFPIRKIANVLFAVRHLGKDFAEMLLLGEVIDRAVTNGDIRAEGTATEDAQIARSRRYRRAFDRALADTDTALLWGIVGVAIGPVRGVLSAGMRGLRALWHGSGEDAVGASPEMDAKVSRIETILMQPEVKTFLADFDRRFESVLRETT
jgi:hypothetical protein